MREEGAGFHPSSLPAGPGCSAVDRQQARASARAASTSRPRLDGPRHHDRGGADGGRGDRRQPRARLMADTVLELIELSKRVEQTVPAERLSLSISRGEFFTFLGPSGSGKSTVLRMIAGLERPDAGRILIAGEDVVGVPPWRRHLGMVFQQYAVFPHMSVAENVGYALRVRGAAPRERDARVAALLDLVGLVGLDRKTARLPGGGEQRRVALARARAAEPAILLLGEPLSALDEKIRREMQTELKHIQRRTGTTFLYVTH